METKIDPDRTALIIVDPQNDFLSEDGVVWDLVGEEVRKNDVVEHLVALKEAAEGAGIPVLYSPHYFSQKEYRDWRHLNPIDKVMFGRRMFDVEGKGAEFLPVLAPSSDTIVLSPHKALSGFWANDIQLQLRQRDVQTIVLAGMSANLCVESHLRDAAENGFDVIVVKDATAGPGEAATQAAYVNYGFIATEVAVTHEVVAALNAAAAAGR
ncbi:MAG: cysteine hydrolase family protein [Actinomycetota bacterium]